MLKYGSHYPNLIVLEGLTILINFLYGKNIYEDKNLKSSNSVYYQEIIKSIEKPLFFFLKYCFRLYYKKKFNSEIILSDIGNIWLAFIKPWTDQELEILIDTRKNINNRESSPYSDTYHITYNI